jgi:YVTN family beta-propeller protein
VRVVSSADGNVHRVELGRAHAARAIPVGVKVTAIAAGEGALWVASEEAGTVTRLNPRTGAIVAPVNVGNAPGALAVGEGAVWVVNRADGTVSRIDPDTNSVSWSVGVGPDPTAVAVGEGAAWVAGGEDGTVARVDPDGRRKAQRFKTGSSPSALAVSGGSVWTAAVAPEAAHRGGTLRADIPLTAPAIVPSNWLHEDGYFYYAWMVAGLAYDGLVAYRRVSGSAAGTLVGGLASRPPAPSRDGRTYVFTLRRGIRYSDGTPVSPGDFRASMERYLAVSENFPPMFTGIVGAPRCIREPAHCDLSRGIESDTRARTITVHLTGPTRISSTSSRPRSPTSSHEGHPRAPPRGISRRRAPARTASPAGTPTAAACSSATRTSGRPPRGRPGFRTGSRSRSAGSDAWRRTPRRSTAEVQT